ncbi:hypothetical protein PM082_003177 [Marasmius tenuissimus]|nr:hypothetical protein PM082_003177 [Marasmius tenuissimus]
MVSWDSIPIEEFQRNVKDLSSALEELSQSSVQTRHSSSEDLDPWIELFCNSLASMEGVRTWISQSCHVSLDDLEEFPDLDLVIRIFDIISSKDEEQTEDLLNNLQISIIRGYARKQRSLWSEYARNIESLIDPNDDSDEEDCGSSYNPSSLSAKSSSSLSSLDSLSSELAEQLADQMHVDPSPVPDLSYTKNFKRWKVMLTRTLMKPIYGLPSTDYISTVATGDTRKRKRKSEPEPEPEPEEGEIVETDSNGSNNNKVGGKEGGNKDRENKDRDSEDQDNEVGNDDFNSCFDADANPIVEKQTTNPPSPDKATADKLKSRRILEDGEIQEDDNIFAREWKENEDNLVTVIREMKAIKDVTYNVQTFVETFLKTECAEIMARVSNPTFLARYSHPQNHKLQRLYGFTDVLGELFDLWVFGEEEPLDGEELRKAEKESLRSVPAQLAQPSELWQGFWTHIKELKTTNQFTMLPDLLQLIIDESIKLRKAKEALYRKIRSGKTTTHHAGRWVTGHDTFLREPIETYLAPVKDNNDKLKQAFGRQRIVAGSCKKCLGEVDLTKKCFRYFYVNTNIDSRRTESLRGHGVSMVSPDDRMNPVKVKPAKAKGESRGEAKAAASSKNVKDIKSFDELDMRWITPDEKALECCKRVTFFFMDEAEPEKKACCSVLLARTFE